MRRLERNVIANIDYLIVLTTLPIVLISMKLITEINSALAVRQIIYIAVTLGLSAVIFILPLRRFMWLIPAFYWGSIALLLAVEVFGATKHGAQRWLEIPLLNLSIQPSEIIKSALILMLAYNINNSPPPKEGYHTKDFLKHSFFILLPVVLVKIQPDLGTAILIFVMGYGVLFLVGIHRKILIVIALCAGLCAPIIYENLQDYQLERIAQFLSDKSQYQVKQSIIAIGNGGISGKTLEEATQAQLRFLPVPESDFIFAYFVERFGLIGALGLVFLYGLLVLHLLITSHNFKKDRILQVISASLGLLISIHLCVNILMVMKLAPVVGIPLPFFSYGGSSFLTFGVLFAILQNLLAFRFTFKYNSFLFLHFYKHS